MFSVSDLVMLARVNICSSLVFLFYFLKYVSFKHHLFLSVVSFSLMCRKHVNLSKMVTVEMSGHCVTEPLGKK